MKNAAAAADDDASNSRVFVIAARTSFAVSGCRHILIGDIAIQPTFGEAKQADRGGVLATLTRNTCGWEPLTAVMSLSVKVSATTAYSTG
ncbi:hypothetical protein [Arthrobacter sp. PAMC 25486]|uniref:hypothetical protein n=1 Tax=Arthrobacter sp. PAMC 25486 TaxID=1494608 RepID=UPI0012FEC448|nr:hypothetical protein [Arthrobacter sp. PAMC 25486]